jgi:hypothetical protein
MDPVKHRLLTSQQDTLSTAWNVRTATYVFLHRTFVQWVNLTRYEWMDFRHLAGQCLRRRWGPINALTDSGTGERIKPFCAFSSAYSRCMGPSAVTY